jgi:hypothetical protein
MKKSIQYFQLVGLIVLLLAFVLTSCDNAPTTPTEQPAPIEQSAPAQKQPGTKPPSQTEPSPPQQPSSTPSTDVLSDGRIDISLDGIERTNTYPEELKQPNIPGVSQKEYPAPKAGYNYLVIRLSLSHIDSGFIPADLKGIVDRSVLTDTEGKEYKNGSCTMKGIEFSDPHSLTSSAFAVQGSMWIFLFELPKNTKPARLVFFYPFQESKEQLPTEWYNIEVGLGNQT